MRYGNLDTNCRIHSVDPLFTQNLKLTDKECEMINTNEDLSIINTNFILSSTGTKTVKGPGGEILRGEDAPTNVELQACIEKKPSPNWFGYFRGIKEDNAEP